jgi:hypothetical protein
MTNPFSLWGKETALLKLHAGPRQRILATVVAFCYFWLSTVVACQHTHHALDELASTTQFRSVQSSDNRISAGAQSNANVKGAYRVANGSHCAACEWQAASVSPGLPAFTLILSAPCTPRALTTFPCHRSRIAPSASARAPPHA